MIKCENKSCTSGMEAKWEPVILLWAKGFPKRASQPASVSVYLRVCMECRLKSKPSDFLSPDLSKKILLSFIEQRKAMPDFKTSEITWMQAETFDNKGVKI
jgi:hypothetical protein